MKLLSRALLFLVSCLTFGWAGFEVSSLRAGRSTAATEALAAAGGQPSFLGGSGTLGGDDRYRLSALSVFSNVALHVKDHYVDPDRVRPRDMLLSALEEIERQIAEVLVEVESNDHIRVEVMGKSKVVVNDVDNLWEINLKLRDLFRFFEKHLPPQDDMRLIEYAAVNGALSTLDPHSVLLKPEAFAEMKTSTKGEFGGLGIVISIRDGKLTIVSPIDETPAARAGLQSGDVISRIGDVSTVSMPVEEAVRLLRGPKGSKVTIWVDREGWGKARKFSIIRERIKLESVESELLSGNVGYIKIKNFQQNTGKDLEEHLEKLEDEVKKGSRLKGLVLDLRNNPGGLLEQATRVSDKFVANGDIVTTVGYGNKLREPKRARWSGTQTELPVAVLVNRGSASASEIVAGALKNLDRATIIGETTFGKGSVQVLYDFSDNSALKLTIAQYLTPGDISIQNDGVQPDISLRPAWLREKGVRMFYEDDSHREASLEQHLEKAGTTSSEQAKPAFTFTYLVREKKKDEGEEASEPPEDFPVEFAREYLLSAGRDTRSESLGAGERFVRHTAAKEEEALAARLSTLGVDWRKGSSRKPAAVDVQLELVDNQNDGVVKAGEEVKVRATVTNRGDEPLFRLRGELRSENNAFEGRELLFGYLEPGESADWTVFSRVPREASSRTDELSLILQDARGPIEIDSQLRVTSERVPPPQFAFTWAIDDAERGDGDGVIEVGEGVEFDVLVTNVGPGAADAVSLRLKSAAQEDLFLERGRVRIGEIAPGETKRGRLRFRVPEKQSGRDRLPLELSIFDSPSGEWLEAQFDLHPHRARRATERSRKGTVRLSGGAALERSTSAQAPTLARVETPGALTAEAVVDGHVRVRLPSGAPAFVSTQAVKWVKGPAKKVPGLKATPALRPPAIVIDQTVGGKVLTGDRFRLTGAVTARTLRDLYVLLNGD
ncbi:MAG: MXAN_5808 family serine peptidase, partial [Myxococcota bacterium]